MSETDSVPDIPSMVESIAIFALDEAKERFSTAQAMTPFSMLVVQDKAFIEEHKEREPSECYCAARHTVQNARGASGYAFCYDGYLDTEEGNKDALISETGLPGADKSFAIAYPYTIENEKVIFGEIPVFVGMAENFMIGLSPAKSHTVE